MPDHKKLVPWRFLLFQGEGRAAFGKILAGICQAEEKDPSTFRLETEANRFMRAPLVIAVISRVVKNPAAPEWEQVLSAGAACQNLLIAATALGYGAQWITEWYGYSQGVRAALKLADNERVAGFVYIGTAKEKPDERERPSLADIARGLAALRRDSVVELFPQDALCEAMARVEHHEDVDVARLPDLDGEHIAKLGVVGDCAHRPLLRLYFRSGPRPRWAGWRRASAAAGTG